MGIQKKMIGLVFAFIPLSVFSQRPDYIDQTIYRKDRSVYLLDTALSFNKTEVMSEVHPEDTALVRTIIDNGKIESDYLGFFKRKGYRIKRIRIQDFERLPKDSVSFSPEEKQLLNEYRTLEKKDDSLLSKGQTSDSLVKKMGSSRYSKVVQKENSAYPILFGMYGIYRYQKYTLVLYFAAVHWREIGISYQVYTSPI